MAAALQSHNPTLSITEVNLPWAYPIHHLTAYSPPIVNNVWSHPRGKANLSNIQGRTLLYKLGYEPGQGLSKFKLGIKKTIITFIIRGKKGLDFCRAKNYNPNKVKRLEKNQVGLEPL